MNSVQLKERTMNNRMQMFMFRMKRCSIWSVEYIRKRMTHSDFLF